MTRLLSKVIFAAALLIWGAFPVMAQNTRQQETQINAATFSNCNNQCINGLMVKAYNDGLNAAVGFLNDLNIWTSQNIYVVSPSLPGIGCVNANGPGQPVNYVACGGGGGGAVASVTGTAPIVASPTTGAVGLTCPTCGVTGSPLSQFATTSSAQLLATLSDETGTGLAVFNNTPTLITPNFSGTVTGNNTHPLSILFQGAANTVVGNWTGVTANFLANTMPSCPDTAGNHLNYVNGTGITCGSSGGAGGTVASVTGGGPITASPTTGAVVLGCATCGVTGSPLSQFGATTSAQLAGVLSDETGSGAAVFGTSPVLVTPALGTPASGNLANTTAFPAANLTGLGTNVAAWLATPTSANLASALTDETGSGAAVFATSPVLVTPALGTPASGNLANTTAFPAANLGGLGTGVATALGNAVNAAGGLATSAVTTLSSLSSIGTITTGVWQGTIINPTFGGTGINNGSKTITLGANLTTTGAGAPTLAFGAGSFTFTFPQNSDTVAGLTQADQLVSGGANVTPAALAAGNITIDCGKVALQYIPNTGAFTLTAPANDGACDVQIENGVGAGAVTFSGFNEGTNTGDALTTTNGNIFVVGITRIHGRSHYLISATQP